MSVSASLPLSGKEAPMYSRVRVGGRFSSCGKARCRSGHGYAGPMAQRRQRLEPAGIFGLGRIFPGCGGALPGRGMTAALRSALWLGNNAAANAGGRIRQRFFKLRRAWWSLVLLPAFAGPTPAAAEDLLATLQFQGFVTQGLVVTDRNNFFGPSSSGGGSLQFTEVGVNASLRPRERLLISAQVLGRRAGSDGRDARPKLDHGVVDYQIYNSQRRSVGLQAGRFKNPFGFYNQTRDMSFTRPSILLPQSIYFDRTRSLGLASDGLTVYGEERIPTGTVRAQVGVGRPQTSEDLENALRLDEQSGSLDGRTSVIGQLLYEHDGGRFLAALSAARVRARFDSGRTGPGDADFRFEPWIVSLQYNEENWSLTSEFALRRSSLQGLDFEPANFDITGESWYVQYSRRFMTDWQWLVRYDVLYLDRGDRSGRDFESAGFGPAHSRFARDLTFGLQWRLHPQILLAAEYHNVDGTGWLPGKDNPDAGDTSRRWNMFLLQTSLRF